jgi:hypothetical protein
MASEEMFIWLLTHDHNNGTDCACCSTEAVARVEAVNIILDWVHEIEDTSVITEIVKKVAEKNYTEAVTLYQDNTDEFLTITKVPVKSQDTEREDDTIDRASEYFKEVVLKKEAPPATDSVIFNPPVRKTNDTSQ